MIASVDEIRSHFPALRRTYRGLPVAYFDGPGGTQVPESVAAAVSGYLLGHNANTHWGFPTSAETDDVLRAARQAMADLLNGSWDEIVFGSNMTTLTFHISRSLGRRMEPGSEIVVTELDHRANVDPWRDIARERDLVIRSVPFDPATGRLDVADVARAVGDRTALVAVGGASNALGTINGVPEIAQIAKRHGSLLFVDAVHSVPHLPTDVNALGCDLLACSPYKFYGPHVGVLWGRRELLEDLPSPKLGPASDEAPERLETGTLNHEGIAGTLAAVEFIAGLDSGNGARRKRLVRVMQELHRRGNRLVERMWEGLSGLDRVRTFGPVPGTTPRTPTVSFVVEGQPARLVSRRLSDEHGVFCSYGDFYATDVATRLDVAGDGLVRAGAACYTDGEEVERLIAGVSEIGTSD